MFFLVQMRVGFGEEYSTQLVLCDCAFLHIFPHGKGIYTWTKRLRREYQDDDGFVPSSQCTDFPSFEFSRNERCLRSAECEIGREVCVLSVPAHHECLTALPKTKSVLSTGEHLSTFSSFFPVLLKMNVREVWRGFCCWSRNGCSSAFLPPKSVSTYVI